MRATELWPGLICYLMDNYGRYTQVTVKEVGLSQHGSQRKDSTRVVEVKADEEGRFVEAVFQDTEYNRRWNADYIGKPLYRTVKNKMLISLYDGDRKMAEAEKARKEQERIRELMEAARTEMAALLVKHGIDPEDITVHARFDSEADAAEVQSIRISGESIERMIQVFRDFPNGGVDKPEKDV